MMCRALCLLALCGVVFGSGFAVQDPPAGPPVALAVEIEGQPNPSYVAGKPAYLHIQAVDRAGMPSPVNGDAVVIKTTDPRSRLNGLEVGFVNGKIVLKLQWFTPSPKEGHTIEAVSKGGLKGRVSGIRVDSLPKGTKLSIEEPKPMARYAWSGGMFRIRLKATDENDDPVEHVEVSLRLSKGARAHPHGYYTEDDTGITSGVIFPPEFICPGDEGGGGTVDGDAPLKIRAFVDANGNGDIDDGEPIVEPPPPDLVSSCPQVLLPTALELLKILEEGGILEPPPPPGDDVIVVGVASSAGGQGKGKALGKNKPETLTDRELAKIRAARRFLEDEVIGFIASGKWNGQFSEVHKRVEHLAKFLSDVAPAGPVVQRLECAAKLLKGNPDVKAIRLSIEEPGRRSRFPVGGTTTVFAALFGKGRDALPRSSFADCTRPSLSRVDVTGPGEALAAEPKGLSHGFRCTGVGTVDLRETISFEPDAIIIIGNGIQNGVTAAVIASANETLSFRLVHSVAVLQSPVRFDLDVDANDSLDDDVDGAAKYLPGERGGAKALNPERADFNKIKFQPQRMKLIVEERERGALADYRFVRFTIVAVTSHPGYCSNKSDASVEGEGKEKDYSFSADGDGAATLTVPIRNVKGVRKGIADFFRKDYGGYCEVKAELLKREDDASPVVVEPNPLKIPQDESGDQIADRYQDEQIAKWKEQYGENKDRAFFAPKSDEEKPDPDEGGPLEKHETKGDALTVLMEYRGLILDGGGVKADGTGAHVGGHLRLSASRKEVLLEVDVVAGIPGGALEKNGGQGFTLRSVLDASGRLLIRDGGVALYWLIDEDAVAAPAAAFPNENAVADFLRSHREGDAVEKKLLQRTTTHVMLFGAGNVAGQTSFWSLDEDFSRGATPQERPLHRGTVGFLVQAKAEALALEAPVDEYYALTLTHEVVHHVIDPPDVAPWEGTRDPLGKSPTEHHTVANGGGALMFRRALKENRSFATAKILPVTLNLFRVAENAALSKE